MQSLLLSRSEHWCTILFFFWKVFAWLRGNVLLEMLFLNLYVIIIVWSYFLEGFWIENRLALNFTLGCTNWPFKSNVFVWFYNTERLFLILSLFLFKLLLVLTKSVFIHKNFSTTYYKTWLLHKMIFIVLSFCSPLMNLNWPLCNLLSKPGSSKSSYKEPCLDWDSEQIPEK